MVAVTGGIACGKSEVARVLRAMGVPVLDADDVAHEALAAGGAARDAVLAGFGPGVAAADGGIDRGRLGALVFADPAERRRLEAIVHPPVIARCRAWAARQRAAGRDAAVVVPLLFEAGMADGWAAVVCVAASPATVLRRLRARGLGPADAARRVAAQWPVAEKARRSDHVIRNDGSLEQLEVDTRQVWRLIVKKERANHA